MHPYQVMVILQVHDFETVKSRRDLQARTVNLQEKALDIVHAIDEVNQEATEWTENKHRMREKIKLRTTEIQDILLSIERKLLAEIDNKDMENDFKNMCFGVKTKLHQKLKSNLTMVDFMKLLAEFGDASDLKKFTPIVDEKEKSILGSTVDMKIESLMFEQPTVDIREGLEMMFGDLTRCAEEKPAWDPAVSRRPQQMQSSTNESSPVSDIESHSCKSFVEPQHEINYTEINENSLHTESENGKHDFGSRFSTRFQTGQQKARRRAMKSSSFDAGVLSSPYMTRRQGQGQGHPTVARTENETENGDTYDDMNDTDTHIHHENKNESIHEDRINSAIQSLNPAAQRMSWIRRVSAPSSVIINTLNQRRLSALSILERANIRTEGLNMGSDVESGLNEARLEWLRENFRRSESAEKQSTPEEKV